MSDFYTKIGPVAVKVARKFTVFSTLTPNCYRTDPGDPTTDATQSSVGARTASVIRNAGSREQINAAGAGVWASDWLIYAALGTDLRNGDVVSDGTRAYVLTAAPETDLGFMLAPAEITTVSDATPPSDYIPALWFNDARNSGYIGLTL